MGTARRLGFAALVGFALMAASPARATATLDVTLTNFV